MSALIKLLQKISTKLPRAKWEAFLQRLGFQRGAKPGMAAIAKTLREKVKQQPRWIVFIMETLAAAGIFMAVDEAWDAIFGDDEPSEEAIAAEGLGTKAELKATLANIVNAGTQRAFGDGEPDNPDEANGLFTAIQDVNMISRLITQAGGPRVVEAIMALHTYEPSVIAQVIAARRAGELAGWAT